MITSRPQCSSNQRPALTHGRSQGINFVDSALQTIQDIPLQVGCITDTGKGLSWDEPRGIMMPGIGTRRTKPTDKYVGTQIRVRRLMLGMTQTGLGNAVGVTFQQIQKYEKGTNRVSASRMQQFAKVLDVPVTFFFEGAPEAQVTNQKSSVKRVITPAYVIDFVTSREGQDLMKTFSRIDDRKLTRRIVDLAEGLAVAKRGVMH